MAMEATEPSRRLAGSRLETSGRVSGLGRMPGIVRARTGVMLVRRAVMLRMVSFISALLDLGVVSVCMGISSGLRRTMTVIEVLIRRFYSIFPRQRRNEMLLCRSCQRLRLEQTALGCVVEQTNTFPHCTPTRCRGSR